MHSIGAIRLPEIPFLAVASDRIYVCAALSARSGKWNTAGQAQGTAG